MKIHEKAKAIWAAKRRGWKIRWKNGWDITSSPKHYFWSFTLITMKPWQSIYDEVLTKCLRRNLDKTFTKKLWQIIYDDILTNHLRLSSMKHLRWSLDKSFTKKFWQNIYDEIMTKCLRWSHDKTFTMKSWQIIFALILLCCQNVMLSVILREVK